MPSIMAIVGRIPATTDIMSTDHYTSTTEQKTDKLVTKIRLNWIKWIENEQNISISL